MSGGWENSAAIDALDDAGFSGGDGMAERLVKALERDGLYRPCPALSAAVKELAADVPELFGGEPDDRDDDDRDDDDRDDFGHLHPEGQDLRHAEAWRALSRAGFAGGRSAVRRMARLLEAEGARGALLKSAAVELVDQAPELFWEPEAADDEAGDEPEDLDREALYEGHLARLGPTYEGPVRTDAAGNLLSEAVVGRNGGSARTTAALLAQAGVRPSRGRQERPEPRDASERTSARLLGN